MTKEEVSREIAFTKRFPKWGFQLMNETQKREREREREMLNKNMQIKCNIGKSAKCACGF